MCNGIVQHKTTLYVHELHGYMLFAALKVRAKAELADDFQSIRWMCLYQDEAAMSLYHYLCIWNYSKITFYTVGQKFYLRPKRKLLL